VPSKNCSSSSEKSDLVGGHVRALELGNEWQKNLSSFFFCCSESAVTAWSLAATDMVDDLDIIDSDMVLDADDLKKPDAASLRSVLACISFHLIEPT